MSDLHALLIGVDYYTPQTSPGGIAYPSLNGCVRDIRQTEAHLLDHLRIPQNSVLTLTASHGDGEGPAEPPDRLPTYANMVLAFRELRDRARAGDQVYIHYSGHGGRARTVFSEIKGASGFDEGLVPTDIVRPGAQYLRDVEIAYLVQEILAKDVHLTVVFDSCHSGGATRGVPDRKAVARGIEKADETERAYDGLVAPRETLMASWQSQPRPDATARSASGWLLAPVGYTFLAACRAQESAYEYFPTHDEGPNGALTYWMLDTLRHIKSGSSYKMLYDRVLAKVHGQFANQTPQLQGDVDREIFASDRIPSYYAVSVLQKEGERVELAAGEVQGVGRDDVFDIYPHGTAESDFGKAEHRIAGATVERVAAARAWARLETTEPKASSQVEQGAHAVLRQSMRLQRTVAHFDIEDPDQVTRLMEAVAEHGAGFIRLAETDDALDYQVTVNENGEWEICNASGQALPYIRPALPADDSDTAKKVVERLVHLCKYANILSLSGPDEGVRSKLRVELVRNGEVANSAPVLKPGHRITLNIRNLQQSGELYDATRTLNICVLSLSSDWSVTQVYPESHNFHSLDPDDNIPLEFEAYLPEGHTESRDIFKVFASRDTTSYRWLELPTLDAPLPDRSAARRSAITDVLEQMFARMTDPSTSTRSAKLVGSTGEKSWTVAQVEFLVQE